MHWLGFLVVAVLAVILFFAIVIITVLIIAPFSVVVEYFAIAVVVRLAGRILEAFFVVVYIGIGTHIVVISGRVGLGLVIFSLCVAFPARVVVAVVARTIVHAHHLFFCLVLIPTLIVAVVVNLPWDIRPGRRVRLYIVVFLERRPHCAGQRDMALGMFRIQGPCRNGPDCHLV